MDKPEMDTRDNKDKLIDELIDKRHQDYLDHQKEIKRYKQKIYRLQKKIRDLKEQLSD